MLVDDLYALSGLTSQFPSGADGGVGSLSASGGQTVPDALSCPNCLTDCDEANYCSGCGRTLKYERAAGRSLSGPALPLRNGR